MKILYYDCFSGISGDMNIAALLDIGVNEDYLIDELSKLKVDDEFRLLVKSDMRKGIKGTKFDVILIEEEKCTSELSVEEDIKKNEALNCGEAHPHVHESECFSHIHEASHHHEHLHNSKHKHNDEHEHNHVHSHNHEAAVHNTPHKHEHNHEISGSGHSHNHGHRNLKSIENIINSSELNENVKKLSMDIFRRVAEAEAKIHGKSIEEVHFHEVGATDSIVDIVGAAICIDYLKVDKIMSSPVELGGGFVKCAHGRFPVPAPATLEILKGVPVKSGAVRVETTTPTGAAILAALVDEFTDNMKITVDKIGYGIGNRDTEIPNVLRVVLGHV